MQAALLAFVRALWSQLHWRMLLLTLLPFLASALLWGVALWLGLQPLIDWLQAWFVEHQGFGAVGRMLGWIGLGALKTLIVPLLAMWALLPLMILTALIFVATLAIPAVVRHVSYRSYPALQERHGGSFFGSLWTFCSTFVVFAVLWLVTLPLALLPPLTFVVQPLLWGWLTYRVMAYDALAQHASADERRTLLRRHRWPLLLIGAVAGAMGAAPTLLWLGGALSVILFPLLAAGAIWLYVLVFVFTGLWFQHYCLAALAELRAGAVADPVVHPAPAAGAVLPHDAQTVRFKDIN